MGCVVFTIEAKHFFAFVETGAGAEVGAATGTGAIAPSVSEVPISSFSSMYLLMKSFCLLMAMFATEHTYTAFRTFSISSFLVRALKFKLIEGKWANS